MKEELRLEVPRDTSYLSAVRALVDAAARRAGFDELGAHQIVASVDEACAVAISNAAARASGEHVALGAGPSRLRVVVERDRRRICVRVEDLAGRVDFADSLAADPGQPGDMAFLLISGFMDEVEYGLGPDGPEITLIKFRPGSRSGRQGRS